MITRKHFLITTVSAAAVAALSKDTEAVAAAPPPAGFVPLSPKRIAEIAALLPAAPHGFGPTCKTGRAEWDALRTHPAFVHVIENGEKRLTDPIPPWNNDLYLDYSRTGQRPPGEAMRGKRHAFLAPLVWAECLENKGRFVPKIETVLRELISEPTWTLPAHDAKLESFHGSQYFVDLGAATAGGEVAQALYLLQGVLDPAVTQAVMNTLEKFIFAPLRASYRTGNGHWWMTATSNWNSVCLQGVTCAALFVLPDRNDRAFFVAGAEQYSRNSVDGFLADGWCTEGLGYYNYGFGRYLIMREALWQATSGKLDLFAPPKIRKIATFAPRLEIQNGQWPAIADCRFDTKADKPILAYCSRVLGLGLTAYEKADYAGPGDLVMGSLETFPNSATRAASNAPAAPPIGIRSYFDAAGVLIVRPAVGSANRMAAALKGGSNHETHNHNDVGSFTLVVGDEPLVGDPGGPYAYTNKSFSAERYTAFKLFSSYGHPVPLVGGKAQRPGEETDARIIKTDFTETADTFAMDISPAYPPGAVAKLERTFHYERGGAGSLRVEDAFAFPRNAPQAFGIGLTTHGQCRQTAPDTLVFSRGKESVTAVIVVPEGAGGFTVSSEIIEENCVPFTRIGLHLVNPLASGKVTVTFGPQAA